MKDLFGRATHVALFGGEWACSQIHFFRGVIMLLSLATFSHSLSGFSMLRGGSWSPATAAVLGIRRAR